MSGLAVAAPLDTLAEERPDRSPEVEGPSDPGGTAGRVVTLLLVCGPAVALAALLPFAWGRVIDT
jgi:hypothetical protein